MNPSSSTKERSWFPGAAFRKDMAMNGKRKRGFGSMDPEKQRQIASKGGKAAHQQGRAHEFTPEEARAAGRKGGLAAHHRDNNQREPDEGARGANPVLGPSEPPAEVPTTEFGGPTEEAPQVRRPFPIGAERIYS
jgi:general stress protein YciG